MGCSDLSSATKSVVAIPVSVSINTSTMVWTARFNASTAQSRHKGIETSELKRLHPLAVCTVIPYTSSDVGMASINAAMLAEWIQFYGKLGMKVIVYDR